MKTLQSFWQWLDGKKTTIGAIILFTSAFFSQVIVGIWHLDPLIYHWVQPTIDTLNWIGGTITGIGLTHQVVKANKP